MLQPPFLSKKDSLLVFAYSLLFIGTVVPHIGVGCILAVLPFTGGAWIGGIAAVSLFKTNAAYLPAAWFAVFAQAYVVVAVFKACRRRSRNKAVEHAKCSQTLKENE
jgi:hypothetical protein